MADMAEDSNAVKTEVAPVKMEVDTEDGALASVPTPTAAAAADDDIYEDAGDLEFFDASLPGNPFGNMYLVRVPPYVWEAWDKLDDDAEIQIATLRQWSEVGKNGEQKYRMRMLLRNDLANHQSIPKEYELDLPMVDKKGVQNTQIKNTFVFSEQDLPGFKAKNKLRAEAAAAGIPAHLLRQKTDRVEKPAHNNNHHHNWHHGRRPRQEWGGGGGKTTVSGRIRHELNCAPVKNPESDFILNERARAAMVPKAQVKFGDASKPEFRIIGSGGIANHTYASDFIKTAQAPPKVKKVETKTARMPENDLLDLIFHCFARFRFWSMRALRAEIPQPEIYLRQTLEKVADLHRSGRFANNWELKPENRKDGSATAEVKASEFVAETADTDTDGEDEDVKLEDVVPPASQ
ncbi:transcription initiation factor beta subunit [Niveomyces insectorum RCEF 264]|uniref:Transcription initiation factor IIF subunit beta n=1 Tax=Niveomyces insectorum RCEF 264 TaxID=1081102 RepID=A0A167PFY2_9HYPO|nr:transcription initiation factor beta subunit [Niveomyces insectorum RCEF 264]